MLEEERHKRECNIFFPLKGKRTWSPTVNCEVQTSLNLSIEKKIVGKYQHVNEIFKKWAEVKGSEDSVMAT